MPIYEYVCQSCGVDFEKLTSFSDTSVPDCPSCHSAQVARQLSRPAIHFKGSGWYINDSKPSSKESANGSNGNGAGKEHGDAPKSTEGASEAKTDSAKASGDSAASTKAAEKTIAA